MTRQIVLDTETTGMQPEQGHRVIEIGCIELQNRRPTRNDFHHYLNADRDSDPGAFEKHGLTREFLAGKPRFKDVMPSLVEYLRGAELLIHNADFDVSFLNAELAAAGARERIEDLCTIVDTVRMAKHISPGQRVSLDALCLRYKVDNSRRDLHGALLDARLLAEVYLAMTSGQDALSFGGMEKQNADGTSSAIVVPPLERGLLLVIPATAEEVAAHAQRLVQIAKKAGRCLWPADP